MKKYERPAVLVNEELAEGVYAASGCWKTTWNEHQSKDSAGYFNFQIDGKHADVAHQPNTIITCTFNVPVKVIEVNYTPVDSSSTTSYFKVHSFVRTQPINAGGEGLGFGTLKVVAEDTTLTEITLVDVTATDNGPF